MTRQSLTPAQDEVIDALKETLAEIIRTESAVCKLCGHVVRGTSFGETFQRLGVHGERMHPEFFKQEAADHAEEDS